jgi:type II secretory pathway pseudopilin PulG
VQSDTARAQKAAQALKAADAAVESVRKVHDRFAGDFETVTDTVWPARGIQRAISAVLTAANADAKIDEMLRDVEAGAGPAHTGTRRSDHEPTEDGARESAAGAHAGRDPAAFSSNNLQKCLITATQTHSRARRRPR